MSSGKKHKPKPKSKARSRLKLCFVGHPELDKAQAREVVAYWLDRLTAKYDVVKVVTIEDDPLGATARNAAKLLGIPRQTFDRETNAHNFLPEELTVGTLMWMADAFLLYQSPTRKKTAYAAIAQQMCKRMSKKFRNIAPKE